MSDFSTRNTEMLLFAAKKIYEHKLEKIFGFKTLADKVDHEIIKNLLVQVYSEEETIADMWANRIVDLGGHVDKKVVVGNLKPKILSRILGTKGFFKWVLEEEEAGIKELALQAELIQDNVHSETWSRYAGDEFRHLHMIRTEILGVDSWDIRGTGGARNVSTIYSALYGGILSTLSFITGMFGARTGLNFILISGLATLFAGSISSAGGAYQSLLSEMEVLIRENQMGLRNSDSENEDRKRLLEFYHSEGISEEEANLMFNSIKVDRSSSLENAIDKLGLSSREYGDPIENGITSGISFAIAALVPILPFTISSLRLEDALIISISGSLISLFCIGAAKSIFTRKKWIMSGLRVMFFGGLASAITYFIGTLVSLLA
jgi:VIT1/CCC1 family predicted Fe2+/Mn2+ transporter